MQGIIGRTMPDIGLLELEAIAEESGSPESSTLFLSSKKTGLKRGSLSVTNKIDGRKKKDSSRFSADS